MLIRDYASGRVHFVGKVDVLAVDTICFKEFPIETFLEVQGDFTSITCGDCLLEVAKDLNRRPKDLWVDKNRKEIQNIYARKPK